MPKAQQDCQAKKTEKYPNGLARFGGQKRAPTHSGDNNDSPYSEQNASFLFE